ncbi:hypothetical protein Rsub_04304 [Raphidocelis subcapitata]|uniref:DAPG hydrolase PhiG domain-containing protein n=1 Tax=Raphidocelis subcapitata TaxID=307507 RepID=A0A2V0NVA3_9CHLO|nr:hypothetical protein Rsub_04304 [Raphidocelis subcapitata]|eukprot:GBF91564.1 hypothetical protein Rsub_04304 [Raphidocelis subcapitata]
MAGLRSLARGVTVALCIAVALIHAAGAKDPASKIPKPEPRKSCRPSLGLILQKPISPAQLPVERPPAWPACGLRCAAESSLAHQNNGGMAMRLVHRPIPKVNSSMLTWWFNGFDGTPGIEGDMAHPANGRTYPRYLVWHPTDHLEQFTATPGPTPGNATGAVWGIVEFFGTRGARGHVRGDAPCAWAGDFYTNTRLRVQRVDANGLAMAFEVAGGRKAMQLEHRWHDSPEGLRLTSVMQVGFTPDGALAAAANAVVKRAFGGRHPERAGRIWIEHAATEFSNLQYFLPRLYEQEAAAHARMAASK